MSSLTVNDILEELLDENNRILNELLFAHKCVLKSLEFKEFINSITEQFVDYLRPDVRKKYEELSHGLKVLIDRKWTNFSDELPNVSKTVTVTKSGTSDHPIELDNDYHTTNEDNVTDEEEYISEESVELDVITASKTRNIKHICNRCGSSYEFHEVFELHIQYCRPERQSISSESRPEYHWSDIEDEEEAEEEKKMVSGKLVTLDKCKENQVSDNEETLAEEHLVEESVTDKPSVRTEIISHKRMTRSSYKVVSRQQSSYGLNRSSKLTPMRMSKPNSKGNKKLFLFKCGFNGCNAVFHKRKAMKAHKKKLHQWKCDFPGCDYQTEYEYRLKSHLTTHSNERAFECEYCSKNYKHERALRYHIKTKHLDKCPNDPILVCDWSECHFRTKALSALNAHKRVHTLPFECHICQRRFSSKVNMNAHLISKHKVK